MLLISVADPPDFFQSRDFKSHTSVVDKDGMAVALTTTVNLVFGSLVMDPVTGIIMNDEVSEYVTSIEHKVLSLKIRWTTFRPLARLMRSGFGHRLVSILRSSDTFT